MSCVNHYPHSLPAHHFLIIAHRGASAYAPEHTITSYEMAHRLGADYIEIDLNRTKDNKLVAIHDVTIPYVTGKKKVSDFTLAELKQFSPGHLFNQKHPKYASPTYENLQIPTLDEIIAHFHNDTNYYIEIKSPHLYPNIEKELLKQLQASQLIGQTATLPKVIIQSFDAAILQKINQIEPSIPLIKLYSFKTHAHLTEQELNELQQYASGIGVNFTSLTPSFIKKVQQTGLHVHAYTVNDRKDIQAAIDLGLNGIFTDKTDIAMQIRDL